MEVLLSHGLPVTYQIGSNMLPTMGHLLQRETSFAVVYPKDQSWAHFFFLYTLMICVIIYQYCLQMTQICVVMVPIWRHWKQISSKNLQKSQKGERQINYL